MLAFLGVVRLARCGVARSFSSRPLFVTEKDATNFDKDLHASTELGLLFYGVVNDDFDEDLHTAMKRWREFFQWRAPLSSWF